MASRTAAAKAQPTQLEQLAAEFEGKDVQSRRGQGGGPDLTYISIDATIRRLNDVLGPHWSTRDANVRIFPPPEDSNVWTATVELYLDATVDGVQKTAFGVGSMSNRDLDMAMKSALAEAIKKAGHQLGVALYLWDPEARKRAEKKRALAGGSVAAMKQEVWRLAKERLETDKPTAAQIGKLFDVKPGDLTDEATLRGILDAEGLL